MNTLADQESLWPVVRPVVSFVPCLALVVLLGIAGARGQTAGDLPHAGHVMILTLGTLLTLLGILAASATPAGTAALRAVLEARPGTHALGAILIAISSTAGTLALGVAIAAGLEDGYRGPGLLLAATEALFLAGVSARWWTITLAASGEALHLDAHRPAWPACATHLPHGRRQAAWTC